MGVGRSAVAGDGAGSRIALGDREVVPVERRLKGIEASLLRRGNRDARPVGGMCEHEVLYGRAMGGSGPDNRMTLVEVAGIGAQAGAVARDHVGAALGISVGARRLSVSGQNFHLAPAGVQRYA
jgi:hypothetical protein